MTPTSNGQMKKPERVEPALRLRIMMGSLLALFLVSGLGIWGTMAPIASAVIAPGIVVVDGNDKTVQHPTGGIIGEILVRNGSVVSIGQPLIRLDATQTRAALGVVVSQITQLEGRKARLAAERDQSPDVRFPAGFADTSAEAAEIAQSEQRLYAARQTSKEGQKKQLAERIGQFRKEIEGGKAQLAAKSAEVELMEEELARVSEMHKKSLVPVTRVLTAERDVTRLKGERGMLISSIAKADGQISETELQILALDQTMQSESMKELREVEARIAELLERRNAAQDQLNRIEIVAPHSGIVHAMQVHTVGGVIQPAEKLLTIVPQDKRLEVEVRVAPTDIDQIFIGHKATLRFSAFNHRTTDEFSGTISQASANLSTDPQTGVSYYVARMRIQDEHLNKITELKLVPGMPVETFVETGTRSAFAYLSKPLVDQFQRAFREE